MAAVNLVIQTCEPPPPPLTGLVGLNKLEMYDKIALLLQWKNIRGLRDSFSRQLQNSLENSPFLLQCILILCLYIR